MTPHYRGAHAAAKSGSGFTLYFSTRSGGGGRSGGRTPQHHRGAAAMTFDERVQAVAKKGFTERQARFLTTVMLHAGVCVPRQYARFCGIVHGAEDAEVLRQARAASLRLDVRLPPQPRAHLSPQSARALRGHRRGGQSTAKACHAEPRHPAIDGARRHRGRPRPRVARDRRGEGCAPDDAAPDRG